MPYYSIWSGGTSQDLASCHGPLSLKEEGRGVWELNCLRLQCLLSEIVMEAI